jgi:oligopeptide transport system ATP-binding protein
MGPASMTKPQFGKEIFPNEEKRPDAIILQIHNLKKHFFVTSGLLQRKAGVIKAVDDISFFIREKETLGLVGESGCGKTTAGRCILNLEIPTSGEVIFQGKNLCQVSESEMRGIRQNIQVIFQDPFSSLNPRLTIEQLVGEAPRVFKLVKNNREQKERVANLLSTVGLNPSMAPRYPHELSGGQRQRVGIARALSMEARLIICDEPVSALDVSIQAQIINLLEELQEKLGLSYLFIAHDLSVVRHISHRVAVMYFGKIVEITGRYELYKNPLHPYTRALLSAVPIPDPLVEAKRAPIILKGEVPSPLNPPPGCVFHPRCLVAVTECSRKIPELREISPDHYVSCLKC